MAKRIALDVREVACPEPMELILQEISKIGAGEYLEVTHSLAPNLLFPILGKRGFSYLIKDNRTKAAANYVIYIYLKDDASTCDYIKSLI